MSGQFRENLKRLMGKSLVPAVENKDLVTKSDVPTSAGGGVIPEYTLVSNGLVANNQNLGVVYTATPGRRYILAVWNPRDGDPIFQPGDEDEITLVAIHSAGGGATQGPIIQDSMSVGDADKGGRNALLDFIEKVDGDTTTLLNIAATDGDGGDRTAIEIRRDGTITVEHIQSINNTNGIYAIWEAQ